MTTITAQIKEEFSQIVNDTQEYTLPELKTILGDIFKIKNGGKVAAKKEKKPVIIAVADPASGDDEPAKKVKGRPSKAKVVAKADDKPKRAPSAYNIYFKEQYPIIKEANPGMKAKEILLLVAAEWSANKVAMNAPVDPEV